MRYIALSCTAAAFMALTAAPAAAQSVSGDGPTLCYTCATCGHNQQLREAVTGSVGEYMFEAPEQPIGCPLEATTCSYWTNQYPPCSGTLAAAREALRGLRNGDAHAVVRFAAQHRQDTKWIPARGVVVVTTTCSNGRPVFALPVPLSQRRALASLFAQGEKAL